MNRNDLFQNDVDAYILFGAANRFYLTRLDTSFGCVILTENATHFVTDFRYRLAAEAALPDWKLHFVGGNELYPAIAEIVRNLHPSKVGVECDSLTYNEYRLLEDTLDGIPLRACDAEFVRIRAIKSDEEIERIAKSQQLNETALAKVFSLMKPKMTEQDLCAEYAYQALKAGAEGFAFDPIVACGKYSAEPHHKPGNEAVLHDDPVLFDVGVKYQGYCSDLSRTVCLGTPSKELSAVYESVLKAQSYALSKIRAGITCHEADSYAREYLKANGYGEQFGHSLGHGVGIDIHEFPRVAANNDVLLEPNMVITVEPGVYLPNVGGVRIEDTVAVTEDGIRNLTTMHKKFQI